MIILMIYILIFVLLVTSSALKLQSNIKRLAPCSLIKSSSMISMSPVLTSSEVDLSSLSSNTKVLESNPVPLTFPAIEPAVKKDDMKEANFQDTFVEVFSEGHTSDIILKTKESIVKKVLRSAADEKQINFEDNDTICVSEGGSWQISGYNVPAYKPSSNYADSNRMIENSLKFISKKGELIRKLVQVERSAIGVAKLCDMLDGNVADIVDKWMIRTRRKYILASMLADNRDDYVETVSFFANRIPRNELPNVQNIPFPQPTLFPSSSSRPSASVTSFELVNYCVLPNITYKESILDKFLLGVSRSIVRKEIQWESSTPGIRGLLEEGKHYMLSEQGTPANQHRFVKNSLATLLTPFMPPFYRLFMAGIVPSAERNDPAWLVSTMASIRSIMPDNIKQRIQPGAQLGPWFYAPVLTSIVTPPFLRFLVGPSHANYRNDGQLGGMIVEKCKFLQESNCKGLCLHQCKLPAQEFFADTLGMPLTVQPNFQTQECQWSWGEVSLPIDKDTDFSSGCLSGCPTRIEIRTSKLKEKANICS